MKAFAAILPSRDVKPLRGNIVELITIGFAAEHAAHFGREVIEKVRGWLLQLAEAFHRGGWAEEASWGSYWRLRSSLYSRGVNVDRYREFAQRAGYCSFGSLGRRLYVDVAKA